MRRLMDVTENKEIINTVNCICDSVKRVLKDNFIGFYIYGSLANGGFNIKSSDIDALVVIKNPLSVDSFKTLKQMHEGTSESDSEWLRKVELFYIPYNEMKKYDRTHPPRMRLYEGKITNDFWQGDDWVLHRHVLREQGVIVEGPNPNTMIDPVSSQEIHQAVAEGILKNWWIDKVLQNPDRLKESAYQRHAILTMCRALYTLETGQITSKRASAEWARSIVENRFINLINYALAEASECDDNNYKDTIGFIRYVADRSQSFPKS